MEADPSDGKITFCEIETNGYVIESLYDVKEFWVQLHHIGELLFEQNGFIIYPVVRLEDGNA